MDKKIKENKIKFFKRYYEEIKDNIRSEIQDRYVREGYDSLDDFEEDYYSFKPVSVRDLIVFKLELLNNINLIKNYGFKVPENFQNFLLDPYYLFEEAIFNRPNIKPTAIESEEDEKESKNKSEDKGIINSV